MDSEKEITIHRVFIINLIIKALIGVFELAGGVLLLFITSKSTAKFIEHIFSQEIVEDPKDILVNYLLGLSRTLSTNAQLFGSIYLLIHATLNLGVVIALMSKKLWAYRFADIVLLLFIFYQVFRFSHTHSIFLLFLTAIDVMILVLSWFEYKHLISISKTN